MGRARSALRGKAGAECWASVGRDWVGEREIVRNLLGFRVYILRGEYGLGRPINFVSGRADRRAGVTARARHMVPSQASPSPIKYEPGRVRTGPKNRAFVKAFGLRVKCTSIMKPHIKEELQL